MLIDTGCGICDLKRTVRALTDKPPIVVLTHAHMDHAGGMCAFDQVYLNNQDIPLAKSISREEIMSYADMFGKAGGYQVYDYSTEDVPEFHTLPKFLPLNDGGRFDLGGRTIEAYTIPGHTAGSVALLDGANRLMISGDCFSQPASAADDLIHICEEVLAGKGEPTAYEFLGVPLVQMSYGAVKMSWDPKNLKE